MICLQLHGVRITFFSGSSCGCYVPTGGRFTSAGEDSSSACRCATFDPGIGGREIKYLRQNCCIIS